MAETDSVATLESVTVTYGRSEALRDVTTTFAAGAGGLLGPNGAGESTMVKAVLRFILPPRGPLPLLGRRVPRAPPPVPARGGPTPASHAHNPPPHPGSL